MNYLNRSLASFVIWTLPALVAAGPDLELIMSDADWIGNPPENAWLADDGKHVYYRQKRKGEDYRDVFRVASAGGNPESVAPRDVAESTGYGAMYNLSRDRSVWIESGDVYSKNLRDGVVTQLTNSTELETEPMSLVDGTTVAYKRSGQYILAEIL